MNIDLYEYSLHLQASLQQSSPSKIKFKIPSARHWNDWVDGPKQIFEQPEAL